MKRTLLLSLFVALLVMPWQGVKAAENPFEVRAVHIDFRTEVMTIDALKQMVDDLAPRGINTIVMEWEASFPFERHATLRKDCAFTREDVEEFVAHCSARNVDVIPLQNCFGHCEYILRHQRYAVLREDQKEPSQVCPLKIEDATRIFSEIFRDVADLHPSKYFHIGADETYLLGHCKNCRKVAETEGKSRLFVDYVKAMCEVVRKMGKTPIIWADIILAHPEAVDELPEDLIFVDWNYGWAPNHFGKLDNLLSRGVKMWGAPALRSGPDNIYLTQWMKHFNNLEVFVDFSRKHGYSGMIETSWSTSGLYGIWYDNGYEIFGLQPIRLVYPMSAFRILEMAYAEAVGINEKFDARNFVDRYAVEELGLDKSGADVLWRYFSMPQEIVRVTSKGVKDTKGRALDEILEECESMRSELATLRPKKHREEVAHYLLMLDLRIHYLKFKAVEARYESKDYTAAQSADIAEALRPLLRESKSLDSRFAKLNKGFLKSSEIEYVNRMRSEKMRAIYECVK